jgi:predicted nucleic acid-binding protein
MPSNNSIVYWDTCVFIHRLQGTAEYINILRQLTRAAENGAFEIVTSIFTSVEICYIDKAQLTKTHLTLDQENKIVAFLDNPYIKLRQIDRTVAAKSRSIVRNIPGIKPADALHLATAIVYGVSELQTYDPHLLKANELADGMKIIEPHWLGGQSEIPFGGTTP